MFWPESSKNALINDATVSGVLIFSLLIQAGWSARCLWQRERRNGCDQESGGFGFPVWADF